MCDLRPECVGGAHVERGARGSSPAAVAYAVDTVLLSLPSPSVVREVAMGRNGVIAGSKVKTVIDLSTTGAKVAREIAAALAAKGITAVDSPVSGGVAGAIKGTLAAHGRLSAGDVREISSRCSRTSAKSSSSVNGPALVRP